MDETTTVVAHAEFPKHYGSDPVRFSGRADALFERHLRFDDVIDPRSADARQTFEAAARSVRDVLSQRWIKTQRTYDQQNPKRIYYLSMEFLIGRSLTNNVTNLMLRPLHRRRSAREQPRLVRPGGAGTRCRARQWRSRAAGRVLPRFDGDDAAPGDGLRAALRVRHVPAVDRERLAARASGQLAAPAGPLGGGSRRSEAVEVKLGCTFEMHRGKMRMVADRPSTLIGIPYDRPVVGFGGKTINSLRLWSAAAQDYFDFEEFSSGDFVGALVGSIAAQTLTRVLYPDDSTEMGQELRFAQEYFLVACSLADLVRRFRRDNHDWNAFPTRSPSSSTIPIPPWRCPS